MQAKGIHDSLEHELHRFYDIKPAEGYETAWRAALRREELIHMNTKKQKGLWGKLVPVLCALVLVVGSVWAGSLDLYSRNTVETVTETVSRADSHAEMAQSDGNYSMAGGGYSGSATMSNKSAPVMDYNASDKKLIHTYYITLATQKYDEDKQIITKLIEENKGYTESSYEYGKSESRPRNVEWSLRVPVEQMESFLTGLSSVALITSQSQTTSDVTLQYADNEAKLATYYAKRTRLNELLAEAESVEAIISIESELSNTQYEIDSYESTQRYTERQVEMSAVTVELREENTQTIADSRDYSFGERVSAAFKAAFVYLGQFFENTVVFIVIASPAIAIIALVALVVYIVRRRK